MKKPICGVTLILALLDDGIKTFEASNNGGFSERKEKPFVFYLTGQVIAAYFNVRLIPQDFGCLASGHFCSALKDYITL